MIWIRRHKGLTEIISFLFVSLVFGFVGWGAGIITLVVSVLTFEVIIRTGTKEDNNAK